MADPGKGIRKARTTTAFRVVNFELFAKPNKKVMIFGAACLTGCLTFLLFLNLSHDHTKPSHKYAKQGKTRWER